MTNGSESIDELVNSTDVSQSTVYRKISSLKKRNMIQEKESEEGKFYDLTVLGRAVVQD